MSEVIKIIKENKLEIPIGTILHHKSFIDGVQEHNNEMWNSVGFYVWQSSSGYLNTIQESSINLLKDCYVNCIMLTHKRKFLYSGDEYWKVFIDENHSKYHKLEFKYEKHYPAELLKPYKDFVFNNTNFHAINCQRFETEEEAKDYCNRLKFDKRHKTIKT
jgi:hypothetical protein